MFDQTITRPPAHELSPTQLLRVIEFENGADTFADADRTTSDSATPDHTNRSSVDSGSEQ